MTGSSSQRRKALRARRWKDIPHGFRRPTDEEIESIPIYQPEKPAEAEDAISAASALRSGDNPPKDVFPDTPKEIVEPEPRGEAEGVLVESEVRVVCGFCGHLATKVRPGKYQCDNPNCSGQAIHYFPPKKRRTLWNWLRKLVG